MQKETPGKAFDSWERVASTALGTSKPQAGAAAAPKLTPTKTGFNPQAYMYAGKPGVGPAWQSTRTQQGGGAAAGPAPGALGAAPFRGVMASSSRSLGMVSKALHATNGLVSSSGTPPPVTGGKPSQLEQLKPRAPSPVAPAGEVVLVSPTSPPPQRATLKRLRKEDAFDSPDGEPSAKRPREALPRLSVGAVVPVADDDDDEEDMPVATLRRTAASGSSLAAAAPARTASNTVVLQSDEEGNDLVLGTQRRTALAALDVSWVADEDAPVGGGKRLRRAAAAAKGKAASSRPSKRVVDLSQDEDEGQEDDEEDEEGGGGSGVDDDDDFDDKEGGEGSSKGGGRRAGSALARALGLTVEEGEAFDGLMDKARAVQEAMKARLLEGAGGSSTGGGAGAAGGGALSTVTAESLKALLGIGVVSKGQGVTATSNAAAAVREDGSEDWQGDAAAASSSSSSSSPALSLAPHQLIGVAWLILLYRQGVGGLLADAMGLGKTVQVCTALSYVQAAFRDDGPHLIVCPGSTLGNWQRELKVWCPHLRVGVYRGGPTRYEQQEELMDPMRGRRGSRSNKGAAADDASSIVSVSEDSEDDEEEEDSEEDDASDEDSEDDDEDDGSRMQDDDDASSPSSSRGFDVLITTYSLFDRADTSGEASPDYKFLKSFRYSYLVLDEGHAVKNAASVRHRKLTRIRAAHRLLLSGTPLQNSLPELFALLRVLQPDVFTRGSERAFEQAELMYRGGRGTSIVARLRGILNPFILRRSKEEVLSSLPPKTDEPQEVVKAPEQATVYSDVLAAVAAMSGMRRPGAASAAPSLAAAAAGGSNGAGETPASAIAAAATPGTAAGASAAQVDADAVLAASLAAEEALAAGRKVPRDIAALLGGDGGGGAGVASRGRARRSAGSADTASTGSAASSVAPASSPVPVAPGRVDLGVRLNVPGARQRNGALSQKTMMSMFTALRKAAQHPLLLRRWYTDEPTLRRIAQALLTVGAFGNNVEVGVERALEAMRDMSDLEIHGMCASNGASSTALAATRTAGAAGSGDGTIVVKGGPKRALAGEGGWLGPCTFKPDAASGPSPTSASSAPVAGSRVVLLSELAAAAGIASPDRLSPRELLRLCALPASALLDSGKAEWLASYLPARIAAGHRVLLFSQWTTVLDILGELLNTLRIGWLRLDGSTDVETRQALIDTFSRDESIGVFLLSTRAGGQGLNLTAADTVVIHDCDWNPHNDRQAVDRAHRMGQTRPVTVLRLRCAGTVDEMVEKIAARKMGLDAAFANGGEGDVEGGTGRGGRGRGRKAGGGEDGPDDVPVSELLAAALAM